MRSGPDREDCEMTDKAMTLRLPDEQARELEMVATADGVSVAEAIRTAIEAHIEARRHDAEFQLRLQRNLEEHRAILERLAR
jgi:Arc/MetJ-type ribon-helix-helix transcriptional regulator